MESLAHQLPMTPVVKLRGAGRSTHIIERGFWTRRNRLAPYACVMVLFLGRVYPQSTMSSGTQGD